jgi:putative transposase
VLVPSDADGLRRALAPVHRRYAGIIHARRKRTGHFWQGRFGAAVMDEAHLAAALAYVSLKAVRARLVGRARDWRWSSTRAHLSGKDDGVTALAPVIIRRPGPLELASDAVNPSGRAGYGRSRSPALRQRDTK